MTWIIIGLLAVIAIELGSIGKQLYDIAQILLRTN